MIETKTLSNGAVEVTNFNITDIDSNKAALLKKVLLEKTVVVLKKQPTEPAYFTHFVDLIGNVANYDQLVYDPVTGEKICNLQPSYIDPVAYSNPARYPVQRVTGQKINGNSSGIFGSGILDWHANLNGLTRADGVALQGYKGCQGTSTTWLNTTLAFDDMPTELRTRCTNVYCEYEYSPGTWAKGLPKEQEEAMLANKSFYKMWLIQKNISGKAGIYFYTNNKCRIISEDKQLYSDLYDHVFQDKYMYTHFYDIGDIVLSDQILSLHKRDQNDPEILANRILHRLTFRISNTGQPKWLVSQNQI